MGPFNRSNRDGRQMVYMRTMLRRHLDDIKKYVPEFIPEFVPEFVPEFGLNTDFTVEQTLE